MAAMVEDGRGRRTRHVGPMPTPTPGVATHCPSPRRLPDSYTFGRRTTGAFAPWKVAVSGLHKAPAFRVVGPFRQRSILLDDTCYVLPFDSSTDAALIAAVLTSPAVQNLLCSLTFTDSKRPITKKLLQRVDLAAVIRATEPEHLLSAASSHEASPSRADLDGLLASLERRRLART
jgi:hypothetical protein